MRRRRLVGLVLLSLACSQTHEVDLTLPITSPNIVGTFALNTANGSTLPFSAFTTSTGQWWIVSDAMVISADNTWKETTNYTVFAIADGSASSQQTVVSGTYRIDNGQINFTMTDGGTSMFVGSVTDNVLIVVFNQRRFVYTR